ncbi:hypothetical protein EB796_014987 [Bugula neritina]|uniref:Uncharacterized protein n=1 Tax=Bugula neritina TaxID=10212 RepID=A0A7J7JKQ0_BUGNE|nr:hypothetical protein EB796_014987 [Bugula neritina]
MSCLQDCESNCYYLYTLQSTARIESSHKNVEKLPSAIVLISAYKELEQMVITQSATKPLRDIRFSFHTQTLDELLLILLLVSREQRLGDLARNLQSAYTSLSRHFMLDSY